MRSKMQSFNQWQPKVFGVKFGLKEIEKKNPLKHKMLSFE